MWYYRRLDADLVVMHTRREHAAQLEELQRVIFPTLADGERFKAAHYRKHLELYPEGQFVALDGGSVVAATTTLRLHFDFEHPAAIPADESADAPAPMRLHAGPSTAGQWYEQAIEQEAAGYLAEAVESYRQALLAGGPDADVCYDLAHALAALGRREQAVERYSQAVEIRPGFADAWNNLGAVLCALDQAESACQAYTRALDIRPGDTRALYNLADTLDELGKTADAAPHWRAYLQQDAASPWAAHARRRLASI